MNYSQRQIERVEQMNVVVEATGEKKAHYLTTWTSPKGRKYTHHVSIDLHVLSVFDMNDFKAMMTCDCEWCALNADKKFCINKLAVIKWWDDRCFAGWWKKIKDGEVVL